MKSRSYSSSNSSGQQIQMVRNGSNRESKTSTVNNNNKNVPAAAAAPRKYSDENDGNCYPDEKFEEFINRVRDETRRGGAVTTTTTTTATPSNATATANTNTNTNKGMNKSVVTGIPLSSGWRSVPNNPKNNNNNNNNNARSGQSLIFGKPMSGDTAIEFLLKEAATYNKNPSFNNNGEEKKNLFSHVIKTEKIIDSREASRRYGKIMSRTTTMDEEEEYGLYYRGAIITSNEALEKYNGVYVP